MEVMLMMKSSRYNLEFIEENQVALKMPAVRFKFSGI